MKITIAKNPADPRFRSAAAEAAAGDTQVIDIPNRSLAWITSLMGILSGLTATGGLATFLAITQPKATQEREMAADDARSGALQRALQLESEADRRSSIRLLLAAGVLEVENPRQLEALLAGKEPLPRWPASTPEKSLASTPQPQSGAGTGTQTLATLPR